MKKNLQSFIITNFERKKVKQPVILYENGAVEIPSILSIRAHYLGKQYYSCIKENLAITKDDDYLENLTKQAKVHEYEKQIDQIVYKLYGLASKEIKIVENLK